MKMYREVLAASKGPVTISEICEVIARRPVDRYYISEERGYNIYSDWVKKRRLPQGGYWPMQMYIGYISECNRLVNSGLRPWEATKQAIEKGACCIGLSPMRIYDILLEERAKRKGAK